MLPQWDNHKLQWAKVTIGLCSVASFRCGISEPPCGNVLAIKELTLSLSVCDRENYHEHHLILFNDLKIIPALIFLNKSRPGDSYLRKTCLKGDTKAHKQLLREG